VFAALETEWSGAHVGLVVGEKWWLNLGFFIPTADSGSIAEMLLLERIRREIFEWMDNVQ
jgi:hypothetical protein